jgi:hypothetical protein
VEKTPIFKKISPIYDFFNTLQKPILTKLKRRVTL